MTGSATTTHYGWPYPVGGDPVEVAAYFADLANGIDTDLDAAAHDTGWQDFSVIAPNFSQGPITPQWRRVGPLVVLSGQVQRSVETPADGTVNGTAIFNFLPSPARPASNEFRSAVCATLGARPVLVIYNDGSIQLRNDDNNIAIASGDNINIGCAFFAG